MNDAPGSDLLRQVSIKTENLSMDFSDSSWQYFPYIGISTKACIIFYQGVTIDQVTHVTGPVAQSNVESEYNAACTVGMALAHFRMLIHEFLNKYPDIFPKKAPLVVLDSKSDMCMAKNGKDNKNKRQTVRRIHLVNNG